MSSGSPRGDFFGYVPSAKAAIAFTTIFSLLTIANFVLTTRLRRSLWWFVVVGLGGVCEIVGWAARIAAHNDNFAFTPFITQQVVLILGPCFFSAGLYGLLGVIALHVAPSKAFFGPKKLAAAFVVVDLVCIAVQGAGGGIVSGDIGGEDSGPPGKTGTNVMVVGIILQLVVMVIYLSILALYYIRTRTEPGWRSIRMLTAGVVVASLAIISRGVFRSIELSEGWEGHLYTTEPFLWGLDAVPMVICMLTLCIAHPYFTLPRSNEMIEDDRSLSSKPEMMSA